MTERPRRKRKDEEPGWCVIAWIVRLPGKPDPLPQPYEDRVAPVIRRVNRIFEDCDVRFTVCAIIPLDASQVTIGPRSLASLFAADGSITLTDTVRPSEFLQDFVMNGSDAAFSTKMRERCLHLFFVSEMRFQGSAPPERGSGGWFGADTARTCYAMVGTSGAGGLALNTLAQAVAHEFGHALGLSPPGPPDMHSTVAKNLMKATPGSKDVELNETGQCETILGSLTAHIRRGCP
jgi:hypothetical protein